MNEELSIKSSELKVANTSLENIQNNIGSPLVVVDSEMKLISYNPDANKIFSLSASDIGRSIRQVASQCEIVDFEKKLRETIRTGTDTGGTCEVNENVYQMRVLPNRDESGKIAGAVVIFFNNTEIIRTQEKLQASESNIRSIIDGSPALISLKDAMGHYLVVNEAFRARYGIKDEQIIGKTDQEIFPGGVAKELRDRDLEVLLKRETVESEEKIPFKDREYTLLSSRFPMAQVGNESQVIGTVSLDITAQVEAQAGVKASEARYRAIVEDQAVFVCRYSTAGKFTFTNGTFCTYFGVSPERSRTRTFLSLIDSADQARVQRELDQLSPEHSIVQYETRVIVPSRAGSSPRWVRWIHRALYHPETNEVEYQAVGFDVTEIHVQTDYLLQKENLFTHVLEHTSDYLTVYRIEGSEFILESFNQSAAKNRNYGHVRLVGKRLKDLTDQEAAPQVLKKYEECAKSAKVTTFEEMVETPGGTRHLLTTLVPIRDGEDRIERIAALSRDISNLKRIEHALREQKKTADIANQAKSNFLAAMSHELRTPLSVITGMSQLLSSAGLTARQERYVTAIQESSKTLLSLIEDVLDLSKIEAGKLSLESRPFHVNDVVGEVIKAFETQAAQKGLKLSSKLTGNHCSKLLGDAIRLKQVLINLVGNAIKFTEKGTITVNIDPKTDQSDRYCRVRFEVADTGIGIPEDAFERIFSRFSQADSGISRKFGGSGLGLAICKQLVELMGGEIGFDSKVGAGTTFWFNIDFPRAPETEFTKGNVSQVDPESFKNISLLIVDDNPGTLQVLKEMLEPKVKCVFTANSARNGIKTLVEQPIDVVLMDIQMPQMNGMEATQEIRKLPYPKNKTPLLALTANAMAGDREQFLAAGMDDYLSKPVDLDQLWTKLHHWTQRH